MGAFTPRIGSVSSCSGEGRARGATDTPAAAHRIVAAVAMISAVSGEVEASDSERVEDRRSANELRSLFEKELMFKDWDLSVFGVRISVGRPAFVGNGLGGCMLIVAAATCSSEGRFDRSIKGSLGTTGSGGEISETLLRDASDSDSEREFRK